MGEEKPFEREVLDRLMAIEVILKGCPTCQQKVIEYGTDIAVLKAEIKGMKTTATVAAAVVSGIIQFVSFMAQRGGN